MSTQAAQPTVQQYELPVGDYSVFVNRAGNGEPVLFLHGSGPGATGETNWSGTLPVIGERFDCIAPDLLGYGRSSHPDPPPANMREWTRLRVQVLLGMLDELGFDKVHIVGNSMGGRITLELLMVAPERFDRVVLMGTSGAPTEPTPELQRLANFLESPTPIAMQQLISWFTYDTQVVGEELAHIAEVRLAAATRPEVRRSFETTWTPPFDMVVPPTALERIHHPVLLIHGRNDRFVQLESSEYMNSHLPNADLYVFNKCGHWAMIEKAAKFNRIVPLFLAGELD